MYLLVSLKLSLPLKFWLKASLCNLWELLIPLPRIHHVPGNSYVYGHSDFGVLASVKFVQIVDGLVGLKLLFLFPSTLT